jgi:predicted nuclease of predicted toxin-antitoxin system
MSIAKLKFLADVNIEKPIIDFFRSNGWDIAWVSDFSPKMDDENLIKFARTEKRILLTNDKDFGELVFLQKKLSHGIILLRVKGQETGLKVKLMKRLMEEYAEKLAGHFVVVTKIRFRFIPLEAKK